MLRDMSATEGQGRARGRPVAAGAALSAALRVLVVLPCRGRAVVEFCFFSWGKGPTSRRVVPTVEAPGISPAARARLGYFHCAQAPCRRRTTPADSPIWGNAWRGRCVVRRKGMLPTTERHGAVRRTDTQQRLRAPLRAGGPGRRAVQPGGPSSSCFLGRRNRSWVVSQIRAVPQPVLVAGLILARDQSETAADRLGIAKAVRVVHEGGDRLARAETHSGDTAQLPDGGRVLFKVNQTNRGAPQMAANGP
jgi:hypothetical protein